MNTTIRSTQKLFATTVALLLLAACAPALVKPDGAAAVRSKLTQLQADPQLSTRAPVAIKEAEIAVRVAEVPRQDRDLEKHLVFMADRKVDIAWAQARSRLYEDQRKGLGEEREGARLDARTREADAARSAAESAKYDADVAREQSEAARIEAESARTDASIARSQADIARMDTDAAMRQAADLQRQIAELNARSTDRGLVVTLGDVLFATGGSELKGGAPANLGKLAAFLNKYPDRTVIIEGHTDSVGSEDSNRSLSQRRADSVKSYLVGKSVAPSRLATSGLGESSPVAGNDSATGRQQNRRVEVIISNTVASLN